MTRAALSRSREGASEKRETSLLSPLAFCPFEAARCVRREALQRFGAGGTEKREAFLRSRQAFSRSGEACGRIKEPLGGSSGPEGEQPKHRARRDSSVLNDTPIGKAQLKLVLIYNYRLALPAPPTKRIWAFLPTLDRIEGAQARLRFTCLFHPKHVLRIELFQSSKNSLNHRSNFRLARHFVERGDMIGMRQVID